MLAIAHATKLLAKGDLGAASLKSVVAAMSIAAQQLANCGVDLNASASAGPARLIISEFSALEVERIQAEAEASFHGEGLGSGDGTDAPTDDDDQGNDPSAPAPQN